MYLILLFLSLLKADQASIWYATNQANWPSVFAAKIPSSVQLSNNAQFQWSFPTTPADQSCTTNGKEKVQPCIGKVMNHNFPEGHHQVTLTITDGNQKPITLQQAFDILPLSAFKPALRAEVRNLDKEWWQAYIDALYLLHDLGIYQHMARIHLSSFSANVQPGSPRGAAHSSPSFLTWHRTSMRVMERCVQVAAGDDTLGIPYWDWMKGYTGMESYFGGNGSSSTGVIPDGAFCNDQTNPSCIKKWVLPDDFPDPIKALKRNIGSDPSFHFLTQQELDKLMKIENYDLPPFNNDPTPNSFRNAMEGWLAQSDASCGYNHNGIHRWLGGTISQVSVSFYDPIFLSHHVQVDRLFTQWQQLHKCDSGIGSATCYRPGDTDPGINSNLTGAVNRNGNYVLQGNMFSDQMFPWGIQNKDALPALMGYKFLETNEKPPPIKQVQNVNPVKKGNSGQTLSSSLWLTLSLLLALWFFNE